MATLDSATRTWRQVKRAISVAVLVGGIYLLWLLYTGDVRGPVMLFLGAVLSGLGVVGVLFPSKVRVLNTTSGPD
jgi:hypothetical protein